MCMFVCYAVSLPVAGVWASYPKHFPMAEKMWKCVSGVDKNDTLFHQNIYFIPQTICFIGKNEYLLLYSYTSFYSLCPVCTVVFTVSGPSSRWQHCAMIFLACWRCWNVRQQFSVWYHSWVLTKYFDHNHINNRETNKAATKNCPLVRYMMDCRCSGSVVLGWMFVRFDSSYK